jgi:hypothetical protein
MYCSKDNVVRNYVLKNCEWLSEIGTKYEQTDYLKSKCVLKLFISPTIKKYHILLV